MSQYTLYHTVGCHLCELAEDIIESLPKPCASSFQKIDIATEGVLIERYGIRIPVILSERTGAEIGWPFDGPTLSVWLANN